jgi:hypothetical protein
MKKPSLTSAFAFCGLLLAAPTAFAGEPGAAKPALRHFTTGGSVTKALARMHSQLELTADQGPRVKILLQERAEALHRATEDILKNHRAALEAVLRPEQAKKLVWPQALYWSDEIVAAKVPDLDATQKTELQQLMHRRNASMWTALNGAQARYEQTLKSVLQPEQQTRFATSQSSKTINIEDRE